jgi:hypothetical protein
MKRNAVAYFKIVVSLALFFSFAFGQKLYRPKYWQYRMSAFYDINDSSSITVIDQMNSYYIMQNVLSLTHEIEDGADNRIHFEFHVGGGANFDAENDTTSLLGAISFKINLFNPKIPNAHEVVADIHELQNLTEITGFELPAKSEERIDDIYDRLNKYNRQFWWKRVSIGATVPFSSLGYPPTFDWKETYLFVGYDLGDIITLQVGANMNQRLLLACSVDLSTPLYSLAEDFKHMISRLLNIPGRRNYDWYY